ncbi:Sulfur carrier protein TusA [Halomonadaceae bacterium LMG 33818]|uniref:sulfurtransferase TusA family protein n=1 Tax=Cernens ardua TaxID=3402176 RepID=UPI003EDC1BDA
MPGVDAPEIVLQVDARGLSCPLPLLKAKQGLVGLSEGECLELLATDSGSWGDVASFAALSHHTLISREEEAGEYRFVLRKGV